MRKRSIGRVLAENTARWMSLPGVVGTGEGRHRGKPCIKVYVAEGTLGLEGRIPETVGGHPVIIEVAGRPRALPRDED